ncbi:MAG: polyprenyl synthetase family protein [Actinomycetota bacterium]
MAAPIKAGGIDLPPVCLEIVGRVNDQLGSFVAAQRREMTDRDPSAEPLFAEIERVIRAGGKRLRPLFCCLGHMAAGAEVGEEAIRAAAALELLHTFAIVHDDVMDRSPTRRGSPSSWVHLAEEHRRGGYTGDAEGYGDAAAVLAGDMALVLADRALLESGFPTERLAPAQRRYDRMRVEVVAGQYLDVLAAHRGSASEEEARRIAVLKSGGYTVEAPVQIGAILGGAGEELLGCLSGYGVALGEAFQLRDDVLGTFGDPELTGKDRDSDLLEGKRTVLLAKALAAASGEDRRLLEERVGGADLTSEELDRVRKVIEATGALDATLELINGLADQAKGALLSPPVPEPARGLLTQMADVVAVRHL